MASQWLMGCFCQYGLGIPKNSNTAYRWRQKAAEQDFMLYHDTGTCFRDKFQEIQWLKKMARKGNRYAQYELARQVRSDKRSLHLYQQAAEQGNLSAQYALGNEYAYYGDYCKAAFWYHKAAINPEVRPPHFTNEIGLPQSELGHLYREGKGVERDPARAVYWYEKALDDINDSAGLALGMAYECGYGVEQDINKAITYYNEQNSNLRKGSDELAALFLELLTTAHMNK